MGEKGDFVGKRRKRREGGGNQGSFFLELGLGEGGKKDGLRVEN